MALTRPRYSQIPDSDYKNSCRIVTTTDITLTSGAPQTYDGVTLVQYDRVLVTGQTDKTQNGIYSVSTLGSGSNGTWVRSKDANANDRLTAGMNTFVEEGTYTGQFWHLLTPGPIVLGVTELIFGQISGNAAGTSSQVQYNEAGSISGAANLRYDSSTGNVLIGGGTVSTSNVTGALVLTGQGGAGIGGNVNVGGNVSADKFYTTNGLFWAGNGLAFSSGLEVSEINTANALSNISTQVTAIRFDKDTGFSVTELDPGNIKVSLGSSFKTWHVPGQTDLVAVAEDEVTFFGNGIDITTNPVYPKAITFISNNMLLEANIGAFYNYANANIGSIYNDLNTLDANIGSFQTYSNSAIASIVDNANTNIAAYLTTTTSSNIVAANISTGNIFANSVTITGNVNINGNIFTGNVYTGNIISSNVYTGNITTTGNVTVDGNLIVQSVDVLANIGTLFLGNATTNANLGAYQTWANGQITGAYNEIAALNNSTSANAAAQADSIASIEANIDAITANISAFESYANTKIGTNNNSNLVITSTADSVSASTGALVVGGGAGIGGNLYVAGNIFASNLVSIGTTTLTVTDPLLYLSITNPSPYNFDIGFFSHFVGGTPSHYQHTGLARNYTNHVWGFFSNIRTEPGATIDWSNVEIIYDTVQVGDLIASNTTAATSTTTGALRVAGGAGIAGELYIANTGDVSANIGTLFLGNATTNANLGAFQQYANIEFSSFNVNLTNYQEITNANVGSIYNQLNTLDANVGAFELYANANIGTLYLGNLSTQANIGAYQLYSNANVGSIYNQLNTLDANVGAFELYANANVGTLYLGNLSTQANIGAYQEYANITFTTYSNSNVSAYLPTYTGNIAAGNITVTSNISANKFYTAEGVFWSNGAAYSSGGSGSSFTYTASTSAPVSPVVGDQWFDTADGTLYEYIDDGDSFQWIDIQTPTLSSNAVATALIGDVSTSGNISGSTIIITSGIFWSNGTAFASSLYSNVNVEAYIGGNIGAYQLYANANIGTLYLGNLSTQANLGAYQTYANANAVTQVTSINAINANLGAFQTYSNANAATQATSINTINANLGAYQLYANANIGAFQTFSNANAASQATSINTINANIGAFYNYANTKIGTNNNSNLVVVATTTSTGATTGALVVRGGVGVAGNVYTDKVYTTSGIFWAGNGASFSSGGGGSPFASNIVITSGTASASTTTGAIVTTGSGGIGIGGSAYFGGAVTINSTSITTSPTTGALIVAGGVGVAGDFIAGGFIQSINGVTSTSTGTGAITTQNGGGMGITGNLYVGDEFVVPGGGKITSTGLAYMLEKVTVTTGAPSGNVNIDLSTQSVLYWTGNATGNVFANIRGTATQPLNSLLAVGQSVTAVIFLPNGPSNFLVTNVRIDGTSVTAAYQGNAAPVLGNSNSMDIYSFTILKTASATYKVFASQTQFMHPG